MAKVSEEEGAKFVRYFGPLLDALRGLGGSAKADEAVDRVADDLKLSDDVLNEVPPSGGSRFRNQVAWARFYLVREGLLDSSKHGVWSLTNKGLEASLTYEQSRQIFLKWVKIFQEQRKAKGKAEPAAERWPKGPEQYPTTTGRKYLRYCSSCRQRGLSVLRSEFSGKVDSPKLWSRGRVEMAE